MRKVYLLKNSRFGRDQQYPKEISSARSTLYKSEAAVDARANRRNVQIRYPARLFINGKCMQDMFPVWYEVLGSDRTGGVNMHKKEDGGQKTKSRINSSETIIDSVENSVFTDEKDTG
ncbi:hypothetical protein DPMN_171684 [Dreissena polymorpha]|uniref:Uncharacterized protein n=1 Tax=Dreissena polymorpha TaxID=45954 RepID=A0A9D4E1L3_DREPO|nr:hypothetical protein DPMN_073092 [Dreissena polymorpha]KAH3770399.1 hypothetical protein DPMN_171684 [Dreissena polymorpha]